jgi:hypothetical protein
LIETARSSEQPNMFPTATLDTKAIDDLFRPIDQSTRPGAVVAIALGGALDAYANRIDNQAILMPSLFVALRRGARARR